MKRYRAMATIIIRNLDDQVAERLRLQVRLRGVSVEEEARRVRTEGARVSRAEIAARAAAIRARQPPHRSFRVKTLVTGDRTSVATGSVRPRAAGAAAGSSGSAPWRP